MKTRNSKLYYNGGLKKYSRELRKNMTGAESRLWSRIRMKQIDGLQFFKQRIIGNYIVDFYCPKAKLVIEVDGSQHYSSEGILAGNKRDGYLKTIGLTVLRFNDVDVFKNTEGVVERIVQVLNERQSHLPAGTS